MIKALLALIALAFAASAQTDPPPNAIWVGYNKPGFGWAYTAILLDGLTLDRSTDPPTLRVTVPATTGPTYKFNGPWLRTEIESTGVVSVGLMPGRTVSDNWVQPSPPMAKFVLKWPPADGSITVHVNGLKQIEGRDYTAAPFVPPPDAASVGTPASVTFTTPAVPAATADISITYRTHEK